MKEIASDFQSKELVQCRMYGGPLDGLELKAYKPSQSFTIPARHYFDNLGRRMQGMHSYARVQGRDIFIYNGCTLTGDYATS